MRTCSLNSSFGVDSFLHINYAHTYIPFSPRSLYLSVLPPLPGLFPGSIPIQSLAASNRAENFEIAFRVAEEEGQEPFLEVEDCVYVAIGS